MDNLVFSLDIGTRTIIGIVGEYWEDGRVNVLAYSIKEHKRRNMYDGQIHDIEGVAATVKEIISDLEGQIGKKLSLVSIAAAGRALKTEKIFIEKEIVPARQIGKSDVEVLELEAIQKSQDKINTDLQDLKYYNIGYSVVDYYLNGDRIDKLEDHRGHKIGVELLATFLPQLVVESLYSVIEKVGLEVAGITLEPIAAINVAIKEELRLLNLALVDIGAGTTDIAITKAGQIIAYAMTSIAGDEITEELAREFLLDFNSAEGLKVKLSEREDHSFTDIVGIDYNIKTGQIIQRIQGIIDKIANEIGEKIVEFNGKTPSAVFLVGGSSQMPGLREAIGDKLGLARERVSIRNLSSFEGVVGLKEEGPNMITPVGIALEGARDMDKYFIKLSFNGQEVRMFNTEGIKVSDLLIHTKFQPRRLLAKRSEDITYYLNGRKKLIRGRLGSPPQILVNGERASLQTKLYSGARVEIRESMVEEEEIMVYDIVPRERWISFQGEKINLVKSVSVNNERVYKNISLEENARIKLDEIKSLENLAEEYEITNRNFLVNGREEAEDYILQEGDIVLTRQSKSNGDLDEGPETNVDSKRQTRAQEEPDNKVKTIDLVINNKIHQIKHGKNEFIFVDIFDYIDFDLSEAKGRIVLKLNNEDAAYTDILEDGDQIEIYWD